MAEPGPEPQNVSAPDPPLAPMQAGKQVQQQQHQQDHVAPPA